VLKKHSNSVNNGGEDFALREEIRSGGF